MSAHPTLTPEVISALRAGAGFDPSGFLLPVWEAMTEYYEAGKSGAGFDDPSGDDNIRSQRLEEMLRLCYEQGRADANT